MDVTICVKIWRVLCELDNNKISYKIHHVPYDTKLEYFIFCCLSDNEIMSMFDEELLKKHKNMEV